MIDQPRTTDDELLIDAAGWKPAGPSHWRNRRGGELRITTSSIESVTLSRLDLFRDHMRREVLSRAGGLISADVSTKGVGSVVAKYPQQPSGMTYEGVLVIARNGTEYRVTVRFPETGVTGMRDAAIFTLHMNNASEDADPMEGWMSDPYDRTRRDPLMRNGADDEQYDSKFPDHPLTLLRAELQRLERSL